MKKYPIAVSVLLIAPVLSMAAPDLSPVTIPSVSPTATLVPSVIPSPTVSPTPTIAPSAFPTVAPVNRPEWIHESPFYVGSKSEMRTLVESPAATDVLESEKQEQFLLFPSQANAVFADGLFYQRRLTFDQRFSIHRSGSDKSISDEMLRNMPQVFGSFAYCANTEEFVFQAPPMDGNGKFMLNSKPSRVYLFSLKTGKTELIWRKPRDQFGTLSPKMSATPDCVHILVNQALETKGAKTPYGEIVYLKRPSVQAGSKVTASQDWTYAALSSTNPNGVWMGFGEAVFVMPKTASKYRASEVPPIVFAVTDMVDKKSKSPLVNLFVPSSSRKVVIAEAVKWERNRIDGPSWSSELSSPTFDDSASDVFLLADNFKKEDPAILRSAVVSYDVKNLRKNEKIHIEGQGLSLVSFDLRPSGDGVLISYLRDYQSNQIEKLSDKRIAGLGLVTWQGKKAKWRELHKLFPFVGLENQHYPNPIFGFGGNEVFFVDSIVGEISDSSLFQISSQLKRAKDLQFGGKLKKWAWSDISL